MEHVVLNQPRHTTPKPNTRRLSWIASASIVAIAMGCLALENPSLVRADYSPSQGPYYTDLGPGGTYVSNDGTNLSASDSASAWNFWTGYAQLVIPTGSQTNGCGSTVSCIILVNDGNYITGTSCYVPNLGSGIYAATYLASPGGNLCTTLSSSSYPIYVVSYNDEGGYNSTYRQHIQRHEIGHTLQLNDTSTSCWLSSVYYPIMNNGTFGTCAAYPQNATATANEGYYAGLWAY